jgi:membrane-bound serine protease (ClpP class)
LRVSFAQIAIFVRLKINLMKYILALFASLLALGAPEIAKLFAQSNDDGKKVLLMKIESEIDPRTNRYSELALEEAKNIEADIVILELDTYGGAVTDADDIRTRLLELDKPVWVFINKDAASAGALISIACDSIYMAPGASIGAATVVVGTSGEAAPDKYQSYMRSIMRSTAEANGRDPKIAEAMVDQEIEIDSITEAGKVLTFSTSEALKNGFCEAEVNSVEEILSRNGVTNYELVEFELGNVEKIIRLFLNPVVSGILILVIVGGIYFELQTPGVGFPIVASIIAAVLYFVPYYLNGLAANWEIIIFFVGVVLLALEIFVIPGFGVAGISGLGLMLGSLVLVMLNNDVFDFTFVNAGEIFAAITTTLSGLTLAVLLMFFGGVRLTQTKVFERISLVDTQQRSEGYTSNFNMQSYMGKKGEAYTVLRPSGKILIDGELKDAFTRGDFIEKGKKVEVIGEDGTSLKVKEVQTT